MEVKPYSCSGQSNPRTNYEKALHDDDVRCRNLDRGHGEHGTTRAHGLES